VIKKIISKILLFLNLAIAFILLISIISPYINPNILWPISFLGLFFPIIILSILTLCIIWYKLKKKFFWYNILIILISTPYILRFFSVSDTEIKEDGVNIMSYNVRLFNKWNWINDNNIYEKIINLSVSEKIDIFCIQEYSNPNNDLIFPYKYSHIGIQKNREDWHMAIYSNYPQINKSTVKINDNEMNNICIFSDIIIKNDTIRVYNIHLASNFFNNKDFNKIKSVQKEKFKKGIISIVKKLKDSFVRRGNQVDEIKNHIEESPYPVIICGDFNDTPVSYAYQKLSDKKIDAFLESGNGIGATYIKFPLLRIDYILHDSRINSSEFKTHKNKLSDHRAISCKLIFN